MQLRYSAALAALLGTPAFAAGVSVGVEIPRLAVAEYHRPYVAIWLERADQSVASTLSVWYDVKTRSGEGEGTKWLKDMRQWWRRIGRELQMPQDGVSTATRPVGKHVLNFSEGSVALPKLAPGAYKLFVEASREHGGREVLSIPLQWPPAKAEQLQAQGSSELGAITLELKP